MKKALNQMEFISKITSFQQKMVLVVFIHLKVLNGQHSQMKFIVFLMVVDQQNYYRTLSLKEI